MYRDTLGHVSQAPLEKSMKAKAGSFYFYNDYTLRQCLSKSVIYYIIITELLKSS